MEEAVLYVVMEEAVLYVVMEEAVLYVEYKGFCARIFIRSLC